MKLFALALLATAALAAPKEDLMSNLPDAPAFKSDTYSGYLNVSDTKSLHYTFASSMDIMSMIWGSLGCLEDLEKIFIQRTMPLYQRRRDLKKDISYTSYFII